MYYLLIILIHINGKVPKNVKIYMINMFYYKIMINNNLIIIILIIKKY
mgnify:CR=1 FL=1